MCQADCRTRIFTLQQRICSVGRGSSLTADFLESPNYSFIPCYVWVPEYVNFHMVQTNKCGNGILVSVRKTLTSDELWSADIRVWGCVETRSLLPANQNIRTFRIWKVYQICKFLQIRRWASTCLRRLTRLVLTSWISSITSKISRIVIGLDQILCVYGYVSVCLCLSVIGCMNWYMGRKNKYLLFIFVWKFGFWSWKSRGKIMGLFSEIFVGTLVMSKLAL